MIDWFKRPVFNGIKMTQVTPDQIFSYIENKRADVSEE